ncbi:MAG TPA: hypothetical protein VGM67_16965 [Gemmatimonadaceae bacterium]|jgi:hypothetical protein
MAERRWKIRKPKWLGEVVIQSLAIVFSILLALWTDQWKENRKSRELSVISLRNFLTEIQQNENRLDDALPYHKGLQTMLVQLDSSHAIRTPSEFQNEVGIDGLRAPALLQTAWLTAVATGVLTKLDYETVSALSLTYTLQDRFREDTRTGMQSVVAASNFGPGGAAPAVETAKNYIGEVVTSEDELRSAYAVAEGVVRKKLESMVPPSEIPPQPDSASAAKKKGT